MEDIRLDVTFSEGYLGAIAWEGCNANSHTDIADISKMIKKEFKRRYPNLKIRSHIERFSMGQSLDFVVCVNMEDIITYDELMALDGDKKLKFYNRFNRNAFYGCLDDINPLISDYYEEELASLKSWINNGDTWLEIKDIMISPKSNALDAQTWVQKASNSFNYSDCNGMVDYYDVNFYSHTRLGYNFKKGA